MRMNPTGLQLTLSKNKLRPLQLLVLIVLASIPWRKREFSVGSSLRLLSGVKSSSWGRLFIPVLRENQAPKPGGGTLGLHGL